MGAPDSGMKAAVRPEADELLGAFRTISSSERRRHVAVLDYWLSIRGDKEFPPLHDLDPLEISEAGPSSMLLELISGGHDAEVRHLGDALKAYVSVDSVIEAPDPSLLSCLAKKLPIVAISRDFLAFEDEFAIGEGKVRCWVTLLPLSAGGAWVDYVYALVSLEAVSAAEPAKKPKKAEAPEPVAEQVEEPIAETVEEPTVEEVEEPVAEVVEEPAVEEADEPGAEEQAEPVADEIEEPAAEETQEPDEPAVAEVEEPVAEEPAVDELVEEPVAEEATAEIVEAPAADEVEEPVAEADEAETAEEPEAADPVESAPPKAAAGFSKLFDSLAGLTGFYGSQPVKLDPVIEPADEPAAEAAADEEPAVEAPVEAPVAEEAAVEEPAVEEPIVEEVADEPVAEAAAPEQPKQPAPASEGTLQSKLTEVRAKADEARQARLRATAALYEGLSAAYDFAIDAEDAPEEYLRLVEAQGLKIQLRSPMKPVVKLAFADTCDEATIKQLEAVLAWALKEELPRGTLLERLEAEGGVAGVLKAAA